MPSAVRAALLWLGFALASGIASTVAIPRSSLAQELRVATLPSDPAGQVDAEDETEGPEAWIRDVERRTDDELLSLLDDQLAEAERLLDDEGLDDEDRAGLLGAIESLRDPARRKEYLADLRAATPESVRAEFAPDPDEDGGKENMVVLPPAPNAGPPPPPVAAEPGAGGDVPPLEEPPVENSPYWIYEERTTDQASIELFHETYDAWLKQATAEGPNLTDRWIDPVESCTGPRLGDRFAPTVPTRPGKIYTPTTDTFVSERTSAAPRTIWTAPGITEMGSFVTRGDPANEQFLVEAHISSTPSATGNHLGAFRPIITVTRFDGMMMQISPDNLDVDVLCYADDAGVVGPRRGYVRAWMPGFLLAEPGFQVNVTIGSRSLTNPGANPVLFHGGDQKTVHVGEKPFGAREIVPHAIGLQIDDGLVVDADGDPRNDLESVVVPWAIREAQNALVQLRMEAVLRVLGIPIIGGGITAAAITRPLLADLSFTPVAAGDDERWLSLRAELGEATFRGWYGGLVTGFKRCNFRHLLYVTDAAVDAGVDVYDPDPWLLRPFLATEPRATGHTRAWKLTSGSWLFPSCHIVGALVRVAMKNVAGKELVKQLEKALEPGGPVDDVLASIDLTSTLENGITFENSTNGVRIFEEKGSGWMRTCVPRGCQGGEVAIADEGIEAALQFATADRKVDPGGLPPVSRFRFPLVHSNSSSIDPAALLRTHLDADGHPFSLGVILHNAFLNQLARAITEGAEGPDPADPSLAPNGILDRAGQLTLGAVTIPYRTSPTIAPVFVPHVFDLGNPDDYQGSFWAPDIHLRLAFGIGGPADPTLIAISVVGGFGIRPDVTGQTLDPYVDGTWTSRVLRCNSLAWNDCRLPWAGLPQGFVPTLVDQQVRDLLTDLDQGMNNVTIPQLHPDLVVGNARLQRRGSHLAVYADVYAPARVLVSGWYNKPWYGFNATPEFPPGGNPVTYQWEVRDMIAGGTPVVWSGSTGTVASITRHMDGLARIQLRRSGTFHHSRWLRRVQVKVTATDGSQTAVTTQAMDMITEIW